MRPVSEVIVHCSATRPEWMGTLPTADKVREIRRWHISDRGWKDIGYHYLIDRNGTVATGRPVEQVGAHVQGHNTGTIGVCLIGGHGSSETDRFDEHFTAAQDKALRVLLADLRRKFPGVAKITGHNAYAAKACPGFDVGAWYTGATVFLPKKPAPDRLREAVAQLDAKPVVDHKAAKSDTQIAKPRSWIAALIAAIVALFKVRK